MNVQKLASLCLFAAATCSGGTYSWDDGAGAFSTLSQARGVLLVGYQVTPGNQTIAGMDYRHFWHVANGHAITFHIWTDPSNDGNPIDAQIQQSVPTTIVSPNSSGGFQRIQFLSPVVLNVGDWFYVGHSFFDSTFAYFLSTSDETPPFAGHSWQFDWNNVTPMDANNLAGATSVHHYTEYDVMIHGLTDSEFTPSAVPEPASIMLIGGGRMAVWIGRRRAYSTGRAS
jgi:hypothetical protein